MTNSSSGGSGFDPRFDPAFQPGYKPEVHGQGSRPFAPAPGVDLPPATGAPGRGEGHGDRWRDDPRQADPEAPDTRAAEPQAPVPRAPESREADPRAVGPRSRDRDHGPEEGPTSRRVDAYLMALWVVSLAFVAGGLAVVGYISERLDKLSLTDGGNGFDYYLLQVYTIAAPLLVLLGLATAVGTLFLLAGRRGRTRAR
ncbi:MAG: hypothetical protein JWM49_1816 [Microbacteriaceae bacterium]|nr:hypothetical protein [Microbacteriaceae bacterium]